MNGESIGEVIGRITRQVEQREAEEASELVRERESAQRAEAEREAWERRRRLMARGIPTKDVQSILSSALEPTPAFRAARDFLRDGLARILVLSGVRGCGKTTAASWVIAQECPEPYRAAPWLAGARRPTWPADLAPRFVDVSRLARSGRFEDAVMRPFEDCSMLAIDDLGSEYMDVKGAFLSLLDGLINARYAADLRTVITTNLTGPNFRERYGERIADRIRGVGTFLELAGESLRGRSKETP